jgi:hypothetical protein
MVDSVIGYTHGAELSLDVPEEPPDRSVVLTADGMAWQRFGDVWRSCDTDAFRGIPWALLLAHSGPVRVVYCAPITEEAG